VTPRETQTDRLLVPQTAVDTVFHPKHPLDQKLWLNKPNHLNPQRIELLSSSMHHRLYRNVPMYVQKASSRCLFVFPRFLDIDVPGLSSRACVHVQQLWYSNAESNPLGGGRQTEQETPTKTEGQNLIQVKIQQCLFQNSGIQYIN
jgi:hypothetical protein